jgi:hypothetical protein
MGSVRRRQRRRKGKREHRDERDGRCCGCCTLAHWWHLDNARAGPEDAAENGRRVRAAKRANARLLRRTGPWCNGEKYNLQTTSIMIVVGLPLRSAA